MRFIRVFLFIAVMSFRGALVLAAEDPYRVLGVERFMSLDEMKEHYRRLAFKTHPDRHPEDVAGATARLAAINNAYDLIKKGHTPTARPQAPAPQNTRNWSDDLRDFGFSPKRGSFTPEQEAERILKKYISRFEEYRENFPDESGRLHRELSRLVGLSFAAGSANKGPDPDPLSHLVAQLQADPSFVELIQTLGPDPETRFQNGNAEQRRRLLEGRRPLVNAMELFLIAYNQQLRYVSPEALKSLKAPWLVSGGWGRFEAWALVETLLPFLREAKARNALLTHVLGRAANAREFADMASLYLYEVMNQNQIGRATTSPAQALAHLQWLFAARGREFGLSSIKELYLLMSSPEEISRQHFEFFQRRGIKPISEWITAFSGGAPFCSQVFN